MSAASPRERIAASWDAAPFDALARTAAPIHDALTAAIAPTESERVLDVATGTGALALRAAARGARVTGLDISPRMIAAARRAAAEARVEVEFVLGEAEALPFDRASFDCVVSAQGVMFSSDPEAAARELARVCSSGGRLGLSVLADSPLNRKFLLLWSRFAPGSAAAGSHPADWGDERFVRRLLCRWFELEFVHGHASLAAESAEQLWELHVSSCGPLRQLYDRLSERARFDLRATYVDFFDRLRTEEGVSLPRDYVLILGRRAEHHVQNRFEVGTEAFRSGV